MAVKKKVVNDKTDKEYVCLCCGNKKKEVDFFKSKWSKVWNESDKIVLFCKDCINTLFTELDRKSVV